MGYISRFNKNKTALSQFTKNINIGNSRFMGKEGRFGKSRFTANMEIMIHVGKIAISHFNGKRRVHRGSRKYLLQPSAHAMST